MITVEYIKANQQEHQHIDVMRDMFLHIDDLIDMRDFQTIDDFIENFCKEDICFQYHICLLTAAYWIKNEIKNIEMLKIKAKEVGIKEIGERDTMKALYMLM